MTLGVKTLRILSLMYLFAATAQISSAQQIQSFVALRSGVSFPFGDYKAANLDKGSFTQAGFNISAEGAWYFSKNIGAGISAGLNLHPVDVASLGREQVNREPFLTDVVIRSEPYWIITVMPALFAGYRFADKLEVNGKLGAGLLSGRTPYQLYKPDYFLLPDDWVEVTSDKDHKFSWQAGLGIAWEISSCVGLSLRSDVLYDTLDFTFKTASGKRTDKRRIAMINIVAGFNIYM